MTRIRLFAFASLVALAAACNGGPSGPSQPPPVANAAPVITRIVPSATSLEVPGEVIFTATVTDSETPLNQLTFEWTAPLGGTIAGSGPTATWQPPSGLAEPKTFTVTLTVIERFTSGGQSRENRTTGTSEPVQVRDQAGEVGALALKFLHDFANSDVSPEQCVSVFSENGPCESGKESELNDIRNNRATFIQLNHNLGAPTVTFTNPQRTTASVIVPCEFFTRHKVTGLEGRANGNCRITAVQENSKWWLCTSNFDSFTFNPWFVF